MGIGRFAFTPVLPMNAARRRSFHHRRCLAGIRQLRRLPRGRIYAIAYIDPHLPRNPWVLVIICLGTIAMGFVQTLSGWIVLRAVTGIGSAWALIFVSAWCLDHLKQVGRLALSGAVFAGVGAGILVTGLLCLAFMKAKMISTQAWAGLGRWPSSRPRSSGRLLAPSRRANASCRALEMELEVKPLILCYGAFGFSYIIRLPSYRQWQNESFPTPESFGWMWLAFGAAAIVSTLVAAGTSKRMGNPNLDRLSASHGGWGRLARALASPVYDRRRGTPGRQHIYGHPDGPRSGR